MDLNLKGKKALVTGSSSGIGESIAKCLAREGTHVMLHGRNEEQLKRIQNEIVREGGKANYVKGDLSNNNDAKLVMDSTLNTFNGLDILINNAGAYPTNDWNSQPDDWLNLFNQNVVSMVRMIQDFLPHMKRTGWGRIIQIASVAGISGSRNPIYGVTKASNINMTVSLAKELAGTGITVNTVSPGPISTPGTDEMLLKIAKKNDWKGNLKEFEKKAIKEMFPNMAGRFGKPDDVGTLVAFLASPLADYITGVNYRVDGGRLG